ncbi:MAG: hypothetical protein KAX78_01635 [Phycisphaerae bacterium]|nr:hypothetical protein [Phycisphaerae bacterium]
MARVIQQRTSPPYLAIVFVFLFLVALTLAILFYLGGDKAKKQNAENVDLLAKLVSTSERNETAIQKLTNTAATSRPRVTVVGQLSNRIRQLAKAMIGEEETTGMNSLKRGEEALKQAQELLAKADQSGGLAGQLTDALEKQDKGAKELKNLKAQLALKTGELQKKQKQVDQLSAEQKASLDRLRGQFTDVDKQAHQRETDHQTKLKAAEDEWRRIRADLDANIAEKAQQIEQLRIQFQQAQAENMRLRKQIGEASTPQETVAPQPDGQILEVMENRDFCYINIGKDHRVRPGHNFAVYPRSGIPKDGSDKGKIVVVNVKANVSGCRIVSQKKGDPVVVGDLVGNVAFDPTRTYTFVVEGYFDLHGTQRPSALGTEEVKTLIRRHGGKIIDELNIQTDFLVLGSDPVRPLKPRPEDPPATLAVYTERKKTYDNYNSVKTQAQEMNVPILTTNKFLSFIGYSPTRGLGE